MSYGAVEAVGEGGGGGGESGGRRGLGRVKRKKREFEISCCGTVCKVVSSTQGTGRLTATDVVRESTLLLSSTITERALASCYSFNIGDPKYKCACRITN